MTMSEPLQATFFDGMELPLMSSRAASRARTLALLESSAAWVKEHAPASGPRLSDLLASYDRNTSSWRTSQHCLLAQVNGEADGLAEFSETWPSAGMMRNGKTFRRQPWALPIAESASGLWPTPTLPNGGRSVKHVTDWRSDRTAYHNGKKVQVDLRAAVNMWPTPRSCSAMAATLSRLICTMAASSSLIDGGRVMVPMRARAPASRRPVCPQPESLRRSRGPGRR